MNAIEVNSICKSFGDSRVVDNISFQITRGSIFGLLGPNGAGKTTTIRMIMNIIIPDSGEVVFPGLSNRDNASDKIGYLPEERGIYRKMKVVEVLMFLSRLKSMPAAEARKKIDYWLERLDLSDWKKKKVEDLSKGMQQKLQFIGTILHDPDILILDEPFMGLDPLNTKIIKDIIQELNKKGTSIMFSTHIMENAEKLCDSIMLINKGKNILSGKLTDIKKSYGHRNIILRFNGPDSFLQRSTYIEKFDHSGNFIEVLLKEGSDPQKFLKEVVQTVQITKFEIVEPSLNNIFIESVNNYSGGSNE